MTLTNSTVTGNGSSNAIGGGIVNQAGTLTLRNVTLAPTSAAGWRPTWARTRRCRTRSSARATGRQQRRLRRRRADHVLRGGRPRQPITKDLGNNLAEDDDLRASPVHPADPPARPGRDNGGATPTAALLHGSPAIDAGNDSAVPALDQRGVTRAQGAHCDIGAFEAVKLGAPTVTSARASGSAPTARRCRRRSTSPARPAVVLHAGGTSPTALTEHHAAAARGRPRVTARRPCSVGAESRARCTTSGRSPTTPPATGRQRRAVVDDRPGPRRVVSNHARSSRDHRHAGDARLPRRSLGRGHGATSPHRRGQAPDPAGHVGSAPRPDCPHHADRPAPGTRYTVQRRRHQRRRHAVRPDAAAVHDRLPRLSGRPARRAAHRRRQQRRVPDRVDRLGRRHAGRQVRHQ